MDAASMPFTDRGHKGQAQAGTIGLVLPRLVEALEFFEYRRHLVIRNAGTFVLHGNLAGMR
jgi:hypothetical protein